MNATTPETLDPALDRDAIDAAESQWDDWMFVLYLQALAEDRRPTVH